MLFNNNLEKLDKTSLCLAYLECITLFRFQCVDGRYLLYSQNSCHSVFSIFYIILAQWYVVGLYKLIMNIYKVRVEKIKFLEFISYKVGFLSLFARKIRNYFLWFWQSLHNEGYDRSTSYLFDKEFEECRMWSFLWTLV